MKAPTKAISWPLAVFSPSIGSSDHLDPLWTLLEPAIVVVVEEKVVAVVVV